MKKHILALCILSVGLLSACGQTGSLYLPENVEVNQDAAQTPTNTQAAQEAQPSNDDGIVHIE